MRHDYLVVDGEVFSFQAGDNMFWSQGVIDDNERTSNEYCETVSEDPAFDEAAEEAVEKIGAPKYHVGAYPGTLAHLIGARNCQTWAGDVLYEAKDLYGKE